MENKREKHNVRKKMSMEVEAQVVTHKLLPVLWRNGHVKTIYLGVE